LDVVNVKDIEKYAPHRPPMVWVDYVVDCSATEGECIVNVRGDAHYMSENGMRASACVEFIAQSYGFMSIAYRVNKNPDSQPLKRAFLASIGGAVFAPSAEIAKVKAGDELRVKISNARERGPITAFKGAVLHGSTVLCSCDMKVFSE
jgi:3-hydroxymyristoyl/3-hydroxydecanoyl-(acyl carrier protein) dehydratase